MATTVDREVDLYGIGAGLREARLRRGLELADVERGTCIRTANLEAIEDERFDLLPGDVYAAGFVRTYAEHLGLDAARYVERFRALRAPEPEPFVHEAVRTVEPYGRRRIAALAAGVLACVGAGIGLYLGLRPAHRTAPPAAPKAAPPRHVAKPRPAAPAYPGPLTIRATGGDTWVSVRFGDAHGRVVWQGTLAQGSMGRFGLDRPLWVGLGRPEDVTARIGTKRIPLAPTRSRFVFSSRGVRRG